MKNIKNRVQNWLGRLLTQLLLTLQLVEHFKLSSKESYQNNNNKKNH